MSSSTNSIANLSDFFVGNTIVNQNNVLSTIDAAMFEALEFQSAINPNSAIAIVSGTNTYTLSQADFSQALIGQQLINVTGWTDTGTPKYLSVGVDTQANAEALIRLFGLSSSSPYRTLSFQYVNNSNSTTIASAFVLKNESSTFSNVKITSYSGTIGTSANMSNSTINRNGSIVKIRVFFSSSSVIIFQIFTNPASVSF